MTLEQIQNAHAWLVGNGSPPQLAWTELEYLCGLVASQDLPDGPVMEVGSAWGGTLRMIAIANAERGRGERVCSVDPVSEHHENAFRTVSMLLALTAVCRGEPRVHHLAMTLQDLEAIGMGRKFRLIFVDAWHDYEPVLADLASAARLTLHDGVILSHDMLGTGSFGAERAWKEIVEQGGIPDEGGTWVPEPGFVHSTGTLRWRA